MKRRLAVPLALGFRAPLRGRLRHRFALPPPLQASAFLHRIILDIPDISGAPPRGGWFLEGVRRRSGPLWRTVAMADDSTPPDAAPAKTRLDRVREILDQAAGASTADYQGYGRFWNLPLPQFEAFVLYGIRMIAPAERGNACDDIRSDPEPRGPGREALGT